MSEVDKDSIHKNNFIICNSCCSEINFQARICPICNNPQTRLWRFILYIPQWISAIGLMLVAFGLFYTQIQLNLTQEQVRLQRMLSRPSFSAGFKTKILPDSTLEVETYIKNNGISDAFNLDIKAKYCRDSLGESWIGTASNRIGKLGKGEQHSVPLIVKEKYINWKDSYYIRLIIKCQWSGEIHEFNAFNQRYHLVYDSTKNNHKAIILDDFSWQGSGLYINE